MRLDIRPTVFRLDMAKELSAEAVRQQKEVSVHIKVDTGMRPDWICGYQRERAGCLRYQ